MAVANAQQARRKADRLQQHGWLTIQYEEPPQVPSYFRWKGTFDRLAAAILMVPALPLIGLFALVMRLTTGGSGIFRQIRVGQDGRVFMLLKIRTMAANAEAATGAVWATDRDPRQTRLGKILRQFHLDELPQLVNVLRGEMSLVGPRPERPEFVEVLQEAIPGYSNRLLVPPGITGLAQLNLPPDSNLCSVCRKLAVDMEYVRRASLWMDLRIVLCTIARIPKIPGMYGLFRVKRKPTVEYCAHAKGKGDGEVSGVGAETAQVGPESLECSVTRRMNGHATHFAPTVGLGVSRECRIRPSKPR